MNKSLPPRRAQPSFRQAAPLRRSLPILALAAVALGPSPLAAQRFRPPERISTEGAGVESFDFRLDGFSVQRLLWSDGERVELLSRGPGIDERTEVAARGRAVSLAPSPVGVHLAYLERLDDGEPGNASERLVVRSRIGASLGPLRALGAPALHPARARILSVHGWGQRPLVAWSELERSMERLRLGDASFRLQLERGEVASLLLDSQERAALLYQREGRLFRIIVPRGAAARTLDGGALFNDAGWRFLPEEIDLGEPIRSQVEAGLTDDRLWLLYAGSDGIRLAREGRDGSFDHRVIASPEAHSPHLRSTPVGALALAWVEGGDLWFTLGNESVLPEPERVFASEAMEADPHIDVDSFGNLFLAFRSEGSLWMTDSTRPPTASFRATPLEGEAPLEVEFFDESEGDVTAWSWDFGDGSTSQQQHPRHRFEASGEYTVRLTAAGPGGASLESAELLIEVSLPGNRMWIADTRAFAGQEGVEIPILLTNDRDVQGFQIAAVYDPRYLDVRDLDFRSSNIGTLDAELQIFNVSDDPEAPFVTAGVLLDIDPPFDQRTIGTGRAQRIASLVVDVRPDAPENTSTAVTLVNGVGRPPKNNILVVDSRSLLPLLGPAGRLRVDELTQPPPRFFVRGDLDEDGSVRISDAIRVLNYLFLGLDEPSCFDAADATDDGLVDISDAAYLLNFLFRSGSFLLPPYPAAGLDPTDDELPDCPLFP